MKAYDVVAGFESRVAEFAGAKHGIATDCCTSALFLCMRFKNVAGGVPVRIPCKTYVSVPMAVLHAGGKVEFTEEDWVGVYPLRPYGIHDGAKRFRRDMYEGGLHCLSFHIKKSIDIGRGGMILTDDDDAAKWLRKARYDGREGKPYPEEKIDMLGWHVYMTPEQAARGLALLDVMPAGGFEDQTEDYPDLREMPIFFDKHERRRRA